MKFLTLLGVSQSSILGPLLFSINIIDLFLIEQYKSDFPNYADDTTPYNCGNTFLEAISDLFITSLIGFATINSKQMPQNVIHYYRFLT